MNDFFSSNNHSKETPSWQYYYDAAQEDVPAYKIELAKSNRSKCSARTKTARKCTPSIDEVAYIPKGTVRVSFVLIVEWCVVLDQIFSNIFSFFCIYFLWILKNTHHLYIDWKIRRRYWNVY